MQLIIDIPVNPLSSLSEEQKKKIEARTPEELRSRQDTGPAGSGRFFTPSRKKKDFGKNHCHTPRYMRIDQCRHPRGPALNRKQQRGGNSDG